MPLSNISVSDTLVTKEKVVKSVMSSAPKAKVDKPALFQVCLRYFSILISIICCLRTAVS